MARELRLNQKLLLVPESDDPCQLWISYYRSLKRDLGTEHAKMLWLITWKSNGAVRCTTTPDFAKWLKAHDLDVTTIATRSIADLSAIGGNLLGLGKNMTKVLALGVPIVLVIALVGVVVVLRNTTKQATLSDLGGISPAGLGLKLLQK
jgi:hypothetical protein